MVTSLFPRASANASSKKTFAELPLIYIFTSSHLHIFTAICPGRGQPSAEIVRVECAKCRRERGSCVLSARNALSLSTPTHPHIGVARSHLRIHIVTPSHPPSPFFAHIFSLNSLNCIQRSWLWDVNLNYRLARNCSKISCLACLQFEPGAASSDDVTVVVGALLGVSAARLYRIWMTSVLHDI